MWGGVRFHPGGGNDQHHFEVGAGPDEGPNRQMMSGQNGQEDTHVRPGGDAIPRGIPREISLFGNGYGNNYRPRK